MIIIMSMSEFKDAQIVFCSSMFNVGYLFSQVNKNEKCCNIEKKNKIRSNILKYLPSYHKKRKENIFERNYDIARLIWSWSKKENNFRNDWKLCLMYHIFFFFKSILSSLKIKKFIDI